MEISKIILKISEESSLELTVDQAKDLQKLLNATFEEKNNRIVIEPYIIPTYPTTPWWYPSIITCDTNKTHEKVYTSKSSLCFTLQSNISTGGSLDG